MRQGNLFLPVAGERRLVLGAEPKFDAAVVGMSAGHGVSRWSTRPSIRDESVPGNVTAMSSFYAR